jgi:Mrp family chromosome partitioning ATPase
MGHIAEALRRHDLALSGHGAPDVAFDLADSQPWSVPANPWNIGDAAPSPCPSPPPIGTPSVGTERAPQITGIRIRRPVELGQVSREQLAPIVQCLLHDGAADTRIRSLVFTAIAPEHSSTLCAATAAALAHQTPRSICVVDGNLRDPSLHDSFGVDRAPGVSDVVLQREDLRSCLARVGSNLWFLPAGTPCADAAEVLGGELMRRHLRGMLAEFDYVLLDTSSASVHSDAVALGTLVNAVVLIVGANATRREVAKRAIDRLYAANVKVLGAVLTNRDFPIPETLYRLL